MENRNFNYVCDLVRRISAIVIEDEKQYLIESRLQPLAQCEGYTSVDEIVTVLRNTAYGSLHQRTVESLATNETSFFRDLHPFEALRKVIIPEIIRRRATNRTLRIWSAGCSTGQEPYTLAMLIKEHFPELVKWDVRILATDLST